MTLCADMTRFSLGIGLSLWAMGCTGPFRAEDRMTAYVLSDSGEIADTGAEEAFDTGFDIVDDPGPDPDTDSDTGSDTGTEPDPSYMDSVTYFGGVDGDAIRDVAVGDDGCVVVVGGTASGDFLTSPGVIQETHAGTTDVIVAKFGADGALIWSTLLGGPNFDRAYAVEIDDDGAIYIAGRAGSGFPTTDGALQEDFGGDVDPNVKFGPQDGFVAKINSDGTAVIWSTFLGGDDDEVVRDIAVDSSGHVFVAMSRTERPWPHITSDAFQETLGSGYDGVIAKLSADGAAMEWASYFGGSEDDGGHGSIRVDSAGDAYFLTHTQSTDCPVETDAAQSSSGGGGELILSKWSSHGTLLWATYVGGSENEYSEAHGLALDRWERPVVAGTTRSDDLPVTSGGVQQSFGGIGAFGTGHYTNYNGDAFVHVYKSDGTALVAGSFLGGSAGEGAEGVGVDELGRVVVSGGTYSTDLSASTGAYQLSAGGDGDGFVAVLSSDLSTVESLSYLGGSGTDYGRSLTVRFGVVFLVGLTESTNFPVTDSASQGAYHGDRDGFVAWFELP